MKNIKINLILLTIVFYSVLDVSAQESKRETFPVMIEGQSKFDFAQTVDTLSKILTEGGWKVTMIHDLQETMKKNGKEVLPVKVMEICNPTLAYQILSKDELRDVTPMLPCRVSIYEKGDGKTYVSRMNSPAFAGMIGSDAAATINEAFERSEEFVKRVIR